MSLYGNKTVPGAFFQHKSIGMLIVTFQVSIENGFPDGGFNLPNEPAGLNAKRIHYHLASDGRLPISEMIKLFNFTQSLDNYLIITKIASDSFRIFGSDIGLAQKHQIIQIIPSIKQ